MGIIQVTPRPYYYAKREEERREMPDPVPEIYPNGTVSFRFSVGGVSGLPTEQRLQIKKIISSVLKQKGRFVREADSYGGSGYYEWDQMFLSHNMISTTRFHIENIDPVLNLMKALDEQEREVTTLREASEQADIAYIAAKQGYYNSQAGLLAAELEEGRPCPVCGALSHPSPAQLTDEAVTREEMERADRCHRHAADADWSCHRRSHRGFHFDDLKLAAGRLLGHRQGRLSALSGDAGKNDLR